MAPLLVLLLVTVLARVLGALGVHYIASWAAAAAAGLAVMFMMTGASHFFPRRRAGLVAIVPPPLKLPGALVTATGALELLGAVALLVPPEDAHVRAGAALGLAALLVVMFPANIYASKARRSEYSPTTPLLLRSAMQCVFVAAAVFVAMAS